MLEPPPPPPPTRKKNARGGKKKKPPAQPRTRSFRALFPQLHERTRALLGVVGLLTALGALGSVVLAAQFRLTLGAPAARTATGRDALALATGPLRALPASTGALRELLSARVALRPDARALLALADVRRLQGDRAPRVEVQPSANGWSVTLDHTALGTLSDGADFDDLLALVTLAARPHARAALHDGTPAPEALAWAPLDPAHRTVDTLARLDAAWAAHVRTPAVLAALAQHLVALAVETPDSLEQSDPLVARALAALAWLRAIDAPEVSAEALLARRMDYDRAAAEKAAALPDTSPVRAWVTRDDARLQSLAEGAHATGPARYLWFRRLVERHEPEAARAWITAHLADAQHTLAVTGFALSATAPDDVETLRRERPRAAALRLFALDAEAGVTPHDMTDSQVLPHLSALAAQRPERGHFLDRALLIARDRAAVLSALFDDLRTRLDGPGGVERALALVGSLVGSTQPAYADFTLWAQNLTQSRTGQLGPEALERDLDAEVNPGPVALDLTWRALAPFEAHDALRRRASFERLVTHLDGRPRLRFLHARALLATLADRPRHAARCEAALRLTRYAVDDDALACLRANGDGDALLAFARDPARTADTRSRALSDAAGLVADDALEGAWRALQRDLPEAWAPLDGWTRWRLDRRAVADVEAPLTAWIRTHSALPGAVPMRARARLAAVLRASGRAADAWRAVEADQQTLVDDSLAEGARALLAMGQYDNAEQLARALRTRYGTPDAAALVAEVLWTRAQPDAAAAALGQDARLTDDVWQTLLAACFVRVHAAASAEQVTRAFTPLAQLNVDPHVLAAIPAALLRAGRPGFAALTWDLLAPRFDAGTPAMRTLAAVQGYVYRRALGDEAAARAWLIDRVPASQRAALADAAYALDAHDVLWNVAEPTGTVASAERVWLLRAAASLVAGPADPHRAEVRAHYQGATAADTALGRSLIGEVSWESLRAAADTSQRRAQVSYFMGIRAASAGRFAEASDWFQLAPMFDGSPDGEPRWARAWLARWAARTVTLAELAAHPWASPDAPAAPTVTAPSPAATAAPDAPDDAPRGRHRRHGGAHHGRRRHP